MLGAYSSASFVVQRFTSDGLTSATLVVPNAALITLMCTCACRTVDARFVP